ncbi:TrmB family transcriptional regulator sugar-binding domain-containing protein [Halorubrum sp. F4]|uniref:TrmB family transcriptional regulator n=1 Tax=Halorubrum sp. F4 TaxID=2989715 RepID=UPI00247FD9C6|nr:TrmB family transcriptional regulator sugar-binding domain-containing protein [Halorubrum sp. F4]
MDDRTLTDLLGRFGLSEKEIDTYLTLLGYGEAKASTVADAAGVSKRYVYSVSESLADRGFVEVHDHAVPTTVRANPPEEVIERLRSDADAIRPGLEERYSRAEREAEQFEVVKSRVTVIKRIRSLLEDADAELTLSIPVKHLATVRDALAAALDRGVLVLLVVTDVEDAAEVRDVLGDAEGADPMDLEALASVVRTWGEAMPTMLTVDSARGLVAPPELLRRSDSDRQAIVFAQAQLAPVIVGAFMGNYWPAAAEVARAEPAPLPVEYDDFRQVVFEATLHLRAGRTIRATVAGRRIDEGAEPVEVTGRVRSVKQAMVEPTNNEFPVENSLTVETEDGVVSVGGRDAFVEDVEAELTRLEAE